MTKIYVKGDDLRTAAGRYDEAIAAYDHAVGTYPALLADLPADLRARAEHTERRARADVGEQRTFAFNESADLKNRGLLADLLELGVLGKVFGKMAHLMPGMGRGPAIAKHFGKHQPHPKKKPQPKQDGQGGGRSDDKPKPKPGKKDDAIVEVGGGVDRRATPLGPTAPHDGVIDRTPHDPPHDPSEGPWEAKDIAYTVPLLFARPHSGGGRSPKAQHLKAHAHKAKPKPHPRRRPEPSTFGDDFTP